MIVVKPVALLVVASLVVLGSAVGTFLAVRENRANPLPPAEATAPSQAPSLAESTEEALPPVRPATESAEPITVAGGVDSTTRPLEPRGEADPVPAGSTEAPRPVVEPGAPATVVSAPDEPSSQPADLPPVEGWTQLPERWPSGTASEIDDDDGEPKQIALSTIDTTAIGAGLPPEEQPPTRRELVIARDSVIGLRIDTPVTSEIAIVEDDVEARVTRDVTVGAEVAIPAGTRVLGSVVLVERAGQLRGSARLGVRFHTVVLNEVVELPITTDTVYREGKGRGSKSAAKIGGAAVGGAILGAIFGGRQGAAIGGAAGAAGGTAAAMAGDGQPATLPAGSTVTVRLSRPSTVRVEN